MIDTGLLFVLIEVGSRERTAMPASMLRLHRATRLAARLQAID